MLQVTGGNLNGEQVKASVQSSLNEIKRYLDRLHADAKDLTDQLRTEARRQVEERRRKLLVDGI